MARKMKDSGIEWIGEIPEGWEVCRLKNIVACHDELRKPISADKRENHLKLYDYYGASGVIDTIDDYNVDGTVLLIGEDGANLKLRNLPLIYRASGKFWVNNHAHILIVNKKHSYDYVAYLLEAGDYSNYITGSAQPKLSQFNLMRFPVAIPNYTEQENISFFIHRECSKIDSILSETRSSIEEYKKLKQAVITQAVTKGVRGEREMKDSGIDYIGQIPAKWVLGKLRNVGDTQNGISKSSEFFGKGFPFVSYSDVYKNYSLPFAVSGLVESTPEEQERYSVKEGDIFFTRTSETIEEVGFSCVCEKDIPNATFAGFLIRVRPFSDKLHTPYAKYYFRSTHLRFYLVKEMNLVTRASLGQSLLKSMPVLLPPLEEQKEIADYLDAKCAEIDKLIAKKEQLVKELESYKKSLIYEVVTGKREV